MSDFDRIEVTTKTNSRYGLVEPGDILSVGEDIDKAGADRWLDVGIAKPTDLKKKRSEPVKDEGPEKPTGDNTVKEIKKYLDAEEIDYKSNMTKDELLALV